MDTKPPSYRHHPRRLLLSVLLSIALLLGGCATAPEPPEPRAVEQPPVWLVVGLLVIALFVGFGLARITPLAQG